MNFSKFRNSSKINVLVVGDLMLDNYLIGDCNRISPEAPVQVVEINKENQVLGGAGNVINNLISLGANAGVLSVLGEDDTAIEIINHFEILNVKHNIVFEENRKSSIKNRIIVDKHQIIRFDKESKNDISKKSETKIINSFKRIINNYDIVVLSDYGKGVLTDEIINKIIQISNLNDKKVIVDPKGINFKKYYGAYLMTPNRSEAEKALGFKIDNEVSLKKALLSLKDGVNLDIALITLSEDGIAYFENDFKKGATKAKEVFDVTGAGDTVLASIAIGLALKININKIVDFANATAGIVVGKSGSATVTLDEVEELYCFNIKDTFIDKFLNLKELPKKIKSLKEERKFKIVFTNGCFDILHIGHLSYLERAKQLGDILIVGLNSDRSVKVLKGKTRPINAELDRAKLLCALSFVDFVIIFDEETPDNLIKQISPAVLVKGGDYKKEDIVGLEFSEEVIVLDIVENYSTTKTIKKIKENEK